jgi:hypothetical protein
MARRKLVVAAVAAVAAVALVAVGVVALTRQGSTPPPAPHVDVYTQLARQLKRHLQPLVGVLTPPKQAPTIQVPPQQGYSCETASGTGCSRHPCAKYAQAVGEVAVAATVTATANRCNNTANATSHATPIAVP